MKKEYKKPQIIFESFELSQSIANGCQYISNQAYGICPVDVDGFGALFNNAACEWPGVMGENVCYHDPAEDNRVFTS